ncbi:protein NEDD1 isoform X1 [Arapaima gigas]
MEELTRLVSSGDDVKVWNAVSLTVLEQFNPHSARHPVSRACWSANNILAPRYLVTASTSGDKLVVSSLKSSPVPLIELAEGRKQTRVSLNSSSQFLASGGLDSTVNIWDLKSKKLHRTLQEHKEEVTCVSFNANDGYIASGSTSGDIVLHSVTTNLSSKPFGFGANQPIHDLRYSYVKKSMLGTVSDSGVVVLWDANTQKEMHVFEGAHKAPASGLAFSPANDLLFVTVGLDKKIICYDTSSKIVLRSMRVDSPLTAIDFTPDGAGLAVGSTQGKVYLYDLRNLSAPVKTATAHKTSVTCLRFQHSHAHHAKSSKISSKTSSTKKTSVRLGTPVAPVPTPSSSDTHVAPQAASDQQLGERGGEDAQKTGSAVDAVLSREAEGQHGADHLSGFNRFGNVGRNSLDIFSPVREDYKAHRTSGTTPRDEKKDELDFLSQFSSGAAHRRTPLGTPAGLGPLSVFDTPPPIQEEETSPLRQVQAVTKEGDRDKSSGLTLELTAQAAPGCAGPPVCSPEPHLRSGKEGPGKLHSDAPVGGAARREHQRCAFHLSTGVAAAEGPTEAAGGAPMSNQQVHFIRNMIHKALEDFRSAEATVPGTGPPFHAQDPHPRNSNGSCDTPVNGPASTVAQPGKVGVAETASTEVGGAPLSAVQVHFIRNLIHEEVEDLRDVCHRDIVNLQVEMIRQFYIQLKEIHGLIEKYSVPYSLMEEIERLKEENKRLRTNY